MVRSWMSQPASPRLPHPNKHYPISLTMESDWLFNKQKHSSASVLVTFLAAVIQYLTRNK